VVNGGRVAAAINRHLHRRSMQAGPQVLKANTYGPSRERLSVAAGQVELFTEIEATLVNCCANLLASD
jgi:hypothetical protein